MQPLTAASTWAGPRLRPRRRHLPPGTPVPTERAAALAADCEQLLGEAQRLLNQMIERPWARTPPPPQQSRLRRRRREALAGLPEYLHGLLAWLTHRNVLAGALLVLSLVPSIVYYRVRTHRAEQRVAIPRTFRAPRRSRPMLRVTPRPAPAVTTAPSRQYLGRLGGIEYRYSQERDGVRILIDAIPASNSLALASIIVAVIEDTYGANKLVSLIPYVVPGEAGTWLKFKGREADYFAAISYVAGDPARVNGCYVWSRPKD